MDYRTDFVKDVAEDKLVRNHHLDHVKLVQQVNLLHQLLGIALLVHRITTLRVLEQHLVQPVAQERLQILDQLHVLHVQQDNGKVMYSSAQIVLY